MVVVDRSLGCPISVYKGMLQLRVLLTRYSHYLSTQTAKPDLGPCNEASGA